jgi:hypothetical protein
LSLRLLRLLLLLLPCRCHPLLLLLEPLLLLLLQLSLQRADAAVEPAACVQQCMPCAATLGRARAAAMLLDQLWCAVPA